MLYNDIKIKILYHYSSLLLFTYATINNFEQEPRNAYAKLNSKSTAFNQFDYYGYTNCLYYAEPITGFARITNI